MPDILPDEFRFSHDLAFVLHDVLADHLVEGEKNHIFDYTTDIKCLSDVEELKDLPDDQLIDWLAYHGYIDELKELTYRQLIPALLSDSCHFIYEALSSSAKGKLAVTFTLLRKPLKQNLFYLEWLLSDPNDFCDKFLYGGPELLDTSRNTSLPKDRMIEIIRAALNQTRTGEWISPQFLYEIRYDKMAPYGLERLWNQSTHLITTHKHYTTDSRNFNFIFSDDDSRQEQWNYLYRILPILLYQAVEVVEALIDTITNRDPNVIITPFLRRAIGFALWCERIIQTDSVRKIQHNLQLVIDSLDLQCGECHTPLHVTRDQMEEIYDNGKLECLSCGSSITTFPE